MPTPPVARPYAGPADLAAMQAALSTSWRLARPFSNTTVGDLEWWQVVLDEPGADWTDRIRLWELDGEVVAYAWLIPPAELDWHQRADLSATVRETIVDEALDWATERHAAAKDRYAPEAVRTWAMDDDEELGALLAARGWAPSTELYAIHWYRRLPDEPPAPVVPGGYRLRHVRLPEDLEARVVVDHAAYPPSRVTIARYEALAAMPHYDPSRDLVVEAPDGSLAAFAMTWWDPVARMGEFEPVGTHPAHRGLGLAKALLHAGLRLLRDLGAADAVVFSKGGNEAAEALYASAGFEAVTRHRAWTRPLG